MTSQQGARGRRPPAGLLVLAGLAVIVTAPVALLHAYNVTPDLEPSLVELGMVGPPPATLLGSSRVEQRAARSERRTIPAQRGFRWPLAGAITVTSPYGPRGDGFHHGVDLGCARGQAVGASAPGRVTYAGPARVYGNAITIDHGNGTVTLYAHLRDMRVAAGDVVAGSELLGTCGSTGRSTGPHLHFEVRSGGYVWDPVQILG